MKLMITSKVSKSAQKLKQPLKNGGTKANTNATYQSPCLMTFGSKKVRGTFLPRVLKRENEVVSVTRRVRFRCLTPQGWLGLKSLIKRISSQTATASWNKRKLLFSQCLWVYFLHRVLKRENEEGPVTRRVRFRSLTPASLVSYYVKALMSEKDEILYLVLFYLWNFD